jgi:hypothetical protein
MVCPYPLRRWLPEEGRGIPAAVPQERRNQMSVPQLIARGVFLGAVAGRELASDLVRHLVPWSTDRTVPYLAVTLAAGTPSGAGLAATGEGRA